MRKQTLITLLFVLMLVQAACAVSRPVPPPPAIGPAPTAVMASMPTALPTAIPGSETRIVVEVTPQATEVIPDCPPDGDGEYTPPAGQLRVAYSTSEGRFIWHEETGEIVPYNGFVPATPPAGYESVQASPAGDRFLLTRQLDTETYEIWVQVEGENSEPRLLATVSGAETLERYPDAVGLSFSANWLGQTSWIAYRFHPLFDAIGEVPYEALHAIHSETGEERTLFPAGNVHSYTYLHDSGQLAALMDDGLRLIEAASGRETALLPLPVWSGPDQSYSSSPDGERFVLFVEGGVAVVDPAGGTYTEIPLEYTPVGASHYRIMPGIYWVNDERFYTMIPAGTDYGEVTQINARFEVYEVDTEAGTAQSLGMIIGNFLKAEFSPGFSRLAYVAASVNNTQDLRLSNIVGNEILELVNAPAIELLPWSPDGMHFAYRLLETDELFVQFVCSRGQALDIHLPYNEAWQWVDGRRFLTLEGTFNEAAPQLELHLRSLDGDDTLIAVVDELYPAVEFYFE